MDWQGINDGVSSVGTGVPVECYGVSFAVTGELGRRQGLTALAATGGVAIGTFRSPINGAWCLVVTAAGAIIAVNLASGAQTTLLASGYDVASRPVFAFINGRIYLTNGFDPMYVWNGVDSAIRSAGIAAPAAAPGAPTETAGNVDIGTHLVRYRYIDNTSSAGIYRSNASAAVSVAVSASTKTLTFSIGVGQNIVPSTDPKVTTIQIEATAAAGSTYYVVGTVNNAATTYAYNISDATLQLNDLAALYDLNLPSTLDAGQGHEPAPLGTMAVACRNFAFVGGDRPRTYTVGVTQTSTSVTGTGFSTKWNAQRLIRVGTDPTAYEITSATATTITLTNAYTGSTNASVSAVVYAKNPNRIYWSLGKTSSGLTITLPESFKAAVSSRDVLSGTGDTLVGMAEFNGDLLVFGRYTTQRLVFVDNPGTGELDLVSSEAGLWNDQCLTSVEGVMFGWGPNGVWRMQGGRPRRISHPVDSTVLAALDLTKMDQAFVAYDPIDKVIRWFYVATGDSAPKDSFCLSLESNKWQTEQWRQSLNAGTVAADANGRLRGILSDSSNARLWWNSGTTDGIPTGAFTGYCTGNGVSTTTVTQVSQALPTGALTDLAGVALYRPGTGETVIITSNTASAITHAAFATAVADAEVLYAGSIPWLYSTDWFIGKGQEDRKRARLEIKAQVPSTTTTVRVRIYRDFSSSPLVFTRGVGDVYKDWLSIVNGQSYVEVDLSDADADGFFPLPMFFEFSRSLRATLESIDPRGTVQLLSAEFVIQDRGDTKKGMRDG